MPLFVAQKLYEPLLPLSYLDVLRELDWFDGLCEELRTHPGTPGVDDPRLTRVVASHDRLVKEGAELVGPRSLVPREEAVRGFAAGVLLTAHYEKTVLSSPVVDTHGSRTLLAFRPDASSDLPNRERLRGAVIAALELSPEDESQIDEVLAVELAQLQRCHDLVDALTELLGLADPGPEAVHAAFTALYGSNPLHVGEVDMIRTGSSVFFCLPYSGSVLDTAAYQSRTEPEKAEVAAFLEKVAAFHQIQMGHFPVFGTFRAEAADQGLLQSLSGRLSIPVSGVVQALTTMVAVLRSADVDKYIVHDAWGHQWQAQLLPFEDDFRAIASFENFPSVHAVKRTPQGDETTLAQLFSTWTSASNAEHWDPWLRGAMSRRMLIGVSALIAEMLADIVEYKFIATVPEKAGEMASSSLFKDWPTKLDLTLLDLRVFGRMALKSFYRLVHEEERQTELITELEKACPGRAGAALAAEQLRQRLGMLLDTLYAPRFIYEPTTEGVKLNKFARMALNLLSLHSSLNGVYTKLAASGEVYPEAMRDFRDLLVLSAAAFYQSDPAKNFWHIDEFAGSWFPELLAGFLGKLRELDASCGEIE